MIGPLSGMGWNSAAEVSGEPREPGRDAMTYLNSVTPRWFATYGTRLIAGRDFEARDDAGPPVAIVNDAFARHFFGTRPPVGQRVRYETGPGEMTEVEIVGVVENAAYRGLREAFPPTMYRPAAQVTDPPPFLNLTVRTGPGGAPGLQPALTRAIRGVDPALTVTYRALADRIHDQLTEVRTIAMLSGFFGALALVLAAIGLYGVTSYGVNERRREIGIRLTLGAGRAAAERFVLGRVARLVGDRRRARPRRQRRAVAGRAHRCSTSSSRAIPPRSRSPPSCSRSSACSPAGCRRAARRVSIRRRCYEKAEEASWAGGTAGVVERRSIATSIASCRITSSAASARSSTRASANARRGAWPRSRSAASSR